MSNYDCVVEMAKTVNIKFIEAEMMIDPEYEDNYQEKEWLDLYDESQE